MQPLKPIYDPLMPPPPPSPAIGPQCRLDPEFYRITQNSWYGGGAKNRGSGTQGEAPIPRTLRAHPRRSGVKCFGLGDRRKGLLGKDSLEDRRVMALAIVLAVSFDNIIYFLGKQFCRTHQIVHRFEEYLISSSYGQYEEDNVPTII